MDVNIKKARLVKMNIFRCCFYITLVSNLTIFIAQPLNIIVLETVASRCFMLSNLVAFIFIVMQNIQGCIVPNKTNEIVTIFAIIIFSFVSYLLSSNGGMYNYIIRLWCYLALPFYFLYVDYLEPNKKLISFVFSINFLISMVFILLSFSKYRYAGYKNFLGTNDQWLTLGYDNPNQTAMYLLITIIILFCAICYYSKNIVRILIFLDIIYMVKLLIETSSRTCILIAILITVIILFKKKYTISKYIVIVILLLPSIFMFVYPLFYENRWFLNFELWGKTDYSSRIYMFITALSSVKHEFLFGNFATNQLQNVHNATLSVYSSLGIVGLILFYIYYFRVYFNIISKGFKSRTAYISFIGLLVIFVHACTEAAFIVGGSMYAGILSILIFLVKLDWKEVKYK